MLDRASEDFTELTTPLLLRLPELDSSYANKPLRLTRSSVLLADLLVTVEEITDLEELRTPSLSGCDTVVPILSPSLLATALGSSLDTSLFSSTLEEREEVMTPSDFLIEPVVIIFLGGLIEEIFLIVGELEVTVLGRAKLMPEVFPRLMILLPIGDTCSVSGCWGWVLMGVMWAVTEGL